MGTPDESTTPRMIQTPVGSFRGPEERLYTRPLPRAREPERETRPSDEEGDGGGGFPMERHASGGLPVEGGKRRGLGGGRGLGRFELKR